MKVKRNCQHCGSNEHMVRVIDAKNDCYDVRYRICYKCHPELDSTSHLNGPEGGLKAMKSEHRDSSWDYCEPLSKDMGTDSEDELEETPDDAFIDISELNETMH